LRRTPSASCRTICMHSGLRLAVQQFPAVCEKRLIAGRLGRRCKRDPGPIRGVIDPSGRPRAQNRPEAMPGSTVSRGDFARPTLLCTTANRGANAAVGSKASS
jgi:hypothetical protein